MNINKFFEILSSNPLNITIQYSNINGKEKLLVNGEEVIEDEIKNKIETFKANVAEIDDCLFSEIIDKVEDLPKMNSALELDSYTKEEAEHAEKVMCIMSSLIKDTLKEKIEQLQNLADKF